MGGEKEWEEGRRTGRECRRTPVVDRKRSEVSDGSRASCGGQARLTELRSMLYFSR
jgi:hypothetical protein